MKAIIFATLITVAMSLAAAGTQAADYKSASGGAVSVADMLQRKHESELRAQFVVEGRGDEVRKLDEAAALRLREQRTQRLALVNEQLAQSAGGDSPLLDARAQECDPNPSHVR